MSNRIKARPSARPKWIAAWFAADAVIALAPPLYWSIDARPSPLLGLPVAVVYFVAVATFIAASIVAAYWAEARCGELG